jgi:hypothetical protein
MYHPSNTPYIKYLTYPGTLIPRGRDGLSPRHGSRDATGYTAGGTLLGARQQQPGNRDSKLSRFQSNFSFALEHFYLMTWLFAT